MNDNLKKNSSFVNQILIIDEQIYKNIEYYADNRGFLSQNILGILRNFVEHISLEIYSRSQNFHSKESFEKIKEAIRFIRTKGELSFLSSFHSSLQITTSHYTQDEDKSERLMLKYYEYLIKIKLFLKDKYNLEILKNLHKFPINTDTSTKEYQEKIAHKINTHKNNNIIKDRYYIQKIKPFFVDCEIYYEVTFSAANDYVSKGNRIIAFTKLDISDCYAVRLELSEDSINILNEKMPILIIDNWEVSIRPCEIDNFAVIFGNHPKINDTQESKKLMTFLTKTRLNLVDLVDSSDNNYNKIKNEIISESRTDHIFKLLDKARKIIKGNLPGCNILRYVMYRMNNKIMKQQYYGESNEKLSNLYLQLGCIPFDEMPFCSAPLGHIPKISDIFECIDPENREHELFARFIQNNTEIKGYLYTDIKEIKTDKNIDELIKSYNNKLYQGNSKQQDRKILRYKDFLYIKSYEEATIEIIKKIQELSSLGIDNYLNSIKIWLDTTAHNIDCKEKKQALNKMFEKSKVALIYGAAGTGKSTMINHLSNFFNDKKKLYLAHTNPAVDNLKRKVISLNCEFKTISRFLSPSNTSVQYDLLIIDECSTVSNSDMSRVLKKASFEYLVLVGDVFQIESIRFGNWFNIVRKFVPENSIFELKTPHRSNNESLKELWEKVRNLSNDIEEHITTKNYVSKLDGSIFDHSENDEIILCLNYDGLYGINNFNRFLQNKNTGKSFEWEKNIYKIGDPILFNETQRFGIDIYNNLKGKIVDVKIKTLQNCIEFDIEIFKTINNPKEIKGFELIGSAENKNSIIRFSVQKSYNSDEDRDTIDSIVPFQIAYAVSIHKAQGLEYKSVKIIITNEIEEMITHNIFYTAITRAKEELKIYWSPETQCNVLQNLNLKQKNNITRDIDLLKSKMNYKIIKNEK